MNIPEVKKEVRLVIRTRGYNGSTMVYASKPSGVVVISERPLGSFLEKLLENYPDLVKEMKKLNHGFSGNFPPEIDASHAAPSIREAIVEFALKV